MIVVRYENIIEADDSNDSRITFKDIAIIIDIIE